MFYHSKIIAKCMQTVIFILRSRCLMKGSSAAFQYQNVCVQTRSVE